MTDRLDLTNAFEAAGIERKAAEHLAAEIFDAIRETVATKADLAELRASTKADTAEVNAEIAAVRGEMRAMELRLEARIDRVVVRLGALAVTLAGLLFAALHYWPAHG